MNDKNISYIVFETEMARHERTIKRLLVALVATIASKVSVRRYYFAQALKPSDCKAFSDFCPEKNDAFIFDLSDFIFEKV